ncbi:MAG: cytochrome c oxidase subunit II [Burkholderiales bacterium]
MTRTQRMAAALALSLIGTSAWAEYKLGLQTPQSDLARTIYDLHTIITWICVWIFVGVFGFMLVSLIKHRKSVGHKAAQFHEHTLVEILWTVIPVVILVVMAIPATKALLDQRDTSSPDITVKVTGLQWKWHYDYLHDGVSFYSNLATPRDQIEGKAPKGEHYLLEVDNPMVVPIGKKIRVLLTAADVIHAWYLPAMAAKQDAIPGFIKDLWFTPTATGTFRGQCAELCGKEHGFMPIVVNVVTEDEYKQWLASQKAKQPASAAAPAAVVAVAAPAAAAPAGGKATYEKTCQMCHLPGLMNAPKLGDKAAWAARIAQGNETLYEHALKGFKTMPPKGGAMDVPDADVKAAVDYMVQAAK